MLFCDPESASHCCDASSNEVRFVQQLSMPCLTNAKGELPSLLGTEQKGLRDQSEVTEVVEVLPGDKWRVVSPDTARDARANNVDTDLSLQAKPTMVKLEMKVCNNPADDPLAEKPDEEELTEKPEVQLSTLSAPAATKVFCAELLKTGNVNDLGLELKVREKGILEIEAIGTGLVMSYNKTIDDSRLIQTGDCITVVNGIKADCEKMMEAMKVQQTLTIVLKRFAN